MKQSSTRGRVEIQFGLGKEIQINVTLHTPKEISTIKVYNKRSLLHDESN